MDSAKSIGKPKRTRHDPKPHPGMFGHGRDPRNVEASAKGAAVRWSKDRRTVVAMAQEARPEAFETVLGIMRDPAVEPPTRLRAGELILAYADGRPRQSLDVSVGPRELSALSNDELEATARGAPLPFQLTHKGEVIDAEVVAPVRDKDVALAAQGESP